MLITPFISTISNSTEFIKSALQALLLSFQAGIIGFTMGYLYSTIKRVSLDFQLISNVINYDAFATKNKNESDLLEQTIKTLSKTKLSIKA